MIILLQIHTTKGFAVSLALSKYYLIPEIQYITAVSTMNLSNFRRAQGNGFSWMPRF